MTRRAFGPATARGGLALLPRAAALGVAVCLGALNGQAQDSDVTLLEVPDYEWHAGCFGTATGNLMGFWDRHGFDEFYTGPTANGVAPLTSFGSNAGIFSLWATKAGWDGRPADQPGHEDDYYVAYESTAPDPYITAGRAEHAADCIGDFIGLNQQRWVAMNGECDGNIDGYSFTYWDKTGARRHDFVPDTSAGSPARDIPSGLRAWTQWRGYDAEVDSQLSEFNPGLSVPGFTFEDLKAEIDSGYPVLIFLQDFTDYSRVLGGMPRANPDIHGVLAYGYGTYVGQPFVRTRFSWAIGDSMNNWTGESWMRDQALNLPVRGVITYHPKPKIVGNERRDGMVTLRWKGPQPQIFDAMAGVAWRPHAFVVEQTASLAPADWQAAAGPVVALEATFPEAAATVFYRIKVVKNPSPAAGN